MEECHNNIGDAFFQESIKFKNLYHAQTQNTTESKETQRVLTPIKGNPLDNVILAPFIIILIIPFLIFILYKVNKRFAY